MCAALACGKHCAYVHCVQVSFLLASDASQVLFHSTHEFASMALLAPSVQDLIVNCFQATFTSSQLLLMKREGFLKDGNIFSLCITFCPPV
jgi:hypothetical protein